MIVNEEERGVGRGKFLDASEKANGSALAKRSKIRNSSVSKDRGEVSGGGKAERNAKWACISRLNTACIIYGW
jgi:hypothetical protein